MAISIYILIGVIIIGVFVGGYFDHRFRVKALEGRANLPQQEILKTWKISDFEHPRLSALKIIAKDLNQPMGLLRPTDELARFRSPGAIDDPYVEGLLYRIMKVPGEPDWEKLENLEQILEYLTQGLPKER